LSKLINKEKNKEIIDSIDFESIEGLNGEQFKSVLDDYIDKKINRTKPEITDTIKLMTYSATGIADIKYTLDFKSFENFDELKADFDVKINYMTSSAYSIIISQKDFDLKGNKTINDVNTFIKQEIKKRAIEKNLQNKIVL
jgi:translation initiation factor 2 alpha subunit (eIF-2alpha)